ncbi:hypothetical protein QYF36_003392 [Acer negundo]|nr:hypothetical protein QYF36_003392 [Acer negundo]
MSYQANQIRASNAPNPPNYNRRDIRAPPPPLPPQLPPPPPPLPPQFPPPTPLPVQIWGQSPGFIYYGVEENTYVQLSTTNNGAKLEYHVRQLSPETLSILRESQCKAKITKNSNDITSIYFDKDSIGFDWLISGWLAEKRISSGESYYRFMTFVDVR